ncbi:hypothetical protein J7384_05155 [Endozoicomonas sp. G2_1]|nr:hypothetical protein [Endozoicomonas sp. G2_1]MBO9489749.1 hypothetical protein [Endozoicomonas sp. G2_1]
MPSLMMVFILMMVPALSVLLISLLVSVFENNTEFEQDADKLSISA